MHRSFRFTQLSRLVYVTCIAVGLTACGDITGDSPKIESGDQAEEIPRSTPVTSSPPDPVTGSGWESAASHLTQPATSTILPADPLTTGTAEAPPSNVPPALTAPDPALAESPGLYLRDARDASVFWRGWSPEAFREAEERRLPMIIVIGSAWSHDAREMDAKVFNDAAIADILNSNFIPVRVDADERPDVWSRYRLAFEIINKERARPPLVVFALSDGRPYDIVGAVPPRTEGDVPGLLNLLTQASEVMQQQAEVAREQAETIENVLAQLLTAPRASDVQLSKDLLGSMASALADVAEGDHSDAIRAGRVGAYLLRDGSAAGRSRSTNVASELLLSRFRSGQRDHVMGGYFSRLPDVGTIQFGKLLPVQSELIMANARAYSATEKSLHKEGVTEILRFCRDWLEAPEGGFYVCQVPDLGPGDSGSYFTWSAEEIEEIAGKSAATTVLIEYLNAERGSKTNLHVTGRLQQAADAAGVSYSEASKGLDETRYKLHEARMNAEAVPMVDKSIIAAWNADMICAYLEAAKAVNDSRAREFALQTADLIIESMVSEQNGVARVLYRGRASGFGYLEDNVKVAAALLKCYEETDQEEYLESARSLMVFVESLFLDADSGLYQDVARSNAEKHGLLKLKRLSLEDDIARSENAVAAMAWYGLYKASNDSSDREKAARLVNAALVRRSLDTEAMVSWGEAALLLEY